MTTQLKAARDRKADFPFPMKLAFWLSIFIAAAVVVRRIIALSTSPRPGLPPQLRALDAYFDAHAVVTYTHILIALAFVLLLPLLFWTRTRNSAALERAVFLLGILVAATAYAMSIYAVGGWIERSAVLFFNTLFLIALCRAWGFALSRNQLQKQRWLLRAIAILLGIATTRPVMGAFFATARFTHLTPHQFFGYAFWIGFSINAVTIELWLRHRARSNPGHLMHIGTDSTPPA
ncbi:MAG: DUF2306 domain-containing protein [Acidobacteriaceae bacterium]